MPKIIYNKMDRTGDYSIEFSKKTLEFYGKKSTEAQIFRYYGNLPDNEILVNKLINNLGRNLLALEKEALEIKDSTTNMSSSLKEKTLFYSKMERESNAYTIRVFDCLASLEQQRKPTEEQRANLQQDIKTLYSERIANFEKNFGNADALRKDEIELCKKQMESSRDALLKALGDTNRNTRRIYRQVMENFADEQRIISVYQHNSARPLTYANRSLTEAYQNASYAMEKHIFSTQKPSDKQLWKEVAEQKEIRINTALYPSMRKKDALFSACFIENPGDAFDKYKQAIKQIQDTSRDNRNSKIAEATNSEYNTGFSVFEQYLNSLKGKAAISQPPLSNNPIPELTGEEEVHLYHYTNLYSSIGIACTDIGKYLESQMGAKKPVLTMATFIAMSASFGAAGLAASGSAAAHAALGVYSKLVTANGITGVSPHQCQMIIQNISDTWLNLTYSNGGAFHALIMNMGLGKLGFIGFDKLLNGAEHRDLLSQMAEHLKKQDLTGKTTAEERETILKNILIMSTLLTVAVGLGLAATHLASLTGAAHILGAGMSTLDDTPIEVFTALKATSFPAEIVALCSLALTLKSSALFLGKVAMILDHMNIKDEKKSAACIFMAGLKGTINTNSNLSLLENLDTNKIKEHYDNFQKAINENPELAQLFGSEFLKNIGINVPKPSLISRIQTAGTAVLNGVNNYLVKGTLLPLGQILIAPVSLPLYRYAGVDLGTVKALLSVGDALSKMALGITAAGKLLAISTWGTLQRLTMAGVDTLFGIGLGLNSIVRGGVKGIGWGIRGLLEKPLVNVGSILSDVARFSLGVLKYTVGVSLGALVTAPIWGIRGLIQGKGLKGFTSGFMLPLTFSDYLRNGCQSFKDLCANEVDKINTKLLEAPGAHTIQRVRNASVSNIGYGFNQVKVGLGFLVYRTRSIFIRPQEQLMQTHLKGQEEQIHKAIEQARANASSPAQRTSSITSKPSALNSHPPQLGCTDNISKFVFKPCMVERSVIDEINLEPSLTTLTPSAPPRSLKPNTVFCYDVKAQSNNTDHNGRYIYDLKSGDSLAKSKTADRGNYKIIRFPGGRIITANDELNKARVDFAMTMANQIISSMDPSKASKDNPIILSGKNTIQLRYLWTAFVILGKDKGVGEEAIQVQSENFLPSSEKDNNSDFSEKSLYNTVFRRFCIPENQSGGANTREPPPLPIGGSSINGP